MASDAGIYAQANKPGTALLSPNELMQDAAKTASAVYTNRLQQATQARGQLMQQAIDPATGQFSPTQFNRLLAGTPGAALAAPEAVGQSQGLMADQNALVGKQNQFLQASVSAALKVPDDQIHDVAVGSLSRAADMGLITPQQAIKQAMLFPNNPAALRQHLTQLQMSMMGPDQQRAATYGTPAEQSTGGTLQAGVRAPADQGGGFTPGSTTPLTIGPEGAAQQVPGVDDQGRPTATPLAVRLQQQNVPGILPPQAGGPPARGQLPASLLPPGYTGRYRPGGQPPAAAPAAATTISGMTPPTPYTPPGAPAAPVAAGGAVVTGLAPGQAAEADAAVGHASAARDAANTYQNRMQPLQAAQVALRDAKTGAGSEALNSVRQIVGSFTPAQLDGVRSFIGLGTDQGDASYDEAKKYLTAYTANTPGANRSDAGGATAASANASVNISPLAAQQVVRAAMGMERMRQAQIMEFNQSGQPGSAYDRYQSGAAATADPRAFMADLQTPDERKAMLGKMTAPQKANYLASVRLGMKHGLVRLGGS